MSQDEKDDSATKQDTPPVPPVLSPLGPEVAADDPHGQGDDWDAFREKAKARYPGVDISGSDPDKVRRWIDDIRRRMKMKGSG